MYLTIEIEVGQRLIPCLGKAREIAETLGIDVMVEIEREQLRGRWIRNKENGTEWFIGQFYNNRGILTYNELVS